MSLPLHGSDAPLLDSPAPDLSTPGAVRLLLREACADDHARVDDLFSRFDLSSRVDYARFLAAQAACVAPVEAALTAGGIDALVPDWPARRRSDLIAADLADLGVAAEPPAAVPAFTRPAELLGALYVLEGSRFGGAVLSRRVFAGAPVRFLSAAAPPQAWKALVELLAGVLRTGTDLATASSAARTVFRSFELAGRLTLERPRV